MKTKYLDDISVRIYLIIKMPPVAISMECYKLVKLNAVPRYM